MMTSNAEPILKPEISRVGRFYITRELGRGSIGTVFLGHDPVIDRALAIKTFSIGLTPMKKRQYEQHFINEARAAGRLSHPNIVTIYDASNEGATPYIAMEYLQGRELSKMLENSHPFGPDDVASIIWKIADALEHAHANGVIHRDIKPANIFMVGINQPKVVDFGIARSPNRLSEKPEREEAYTLFQHNNLLGTPNYMSPEQAMRKSVDVRTDIYSLGAVMYEMLAGRKPFQTTSPDQLLQAIAHKAPSSPHELNPKIPLILSKIAMKAMNKRPDKRYQSAAEMASEIKLYLMHERRLRHRGRKTDAAMEPDLSGVADGGRASDSRKYWIAGAAVLTALTTAAFLVWLR